MTISRKIMGTCVPSLNVTQGVSCDTFVSSSGSNADVDGYVCVPLVNGCWRGRAVHTRSLISFSWLCQLVIGQWLHTLPALITRLYFLNNSATSWAHLGVFHLFHGLAAGITPSSITASQTLGTFRRRLKTHLFAVSLT